MFALGGPLKGGIIISKPTFAVKRKYNKMAYQRYELSVGINTKMDHLLKIYKSDPQNNLSELMSRDIKVARSVT